MTTIEWTHRPGTVGASWNPVVGCNRVSPGCKHCYAEVMAARIANAAMARPEAERTPIQHAYIAAVRWRDGKAIPRWSGRVTLIPEKLWEPLRRRRPTTYFANSMSDLFHESLSDEQIAAVFGVMAACPQHTFQVLTKRAERMAEWFRWLSEDPAARPDEIHACVYESESFLRVGMDEQSRGWRALNSAWLSATWPLSNVWLGVSAETQGRADERIPALLRCPAAVRFVSYEPALGPVDFRQISTTDSDGGYVLLFPLAGEFTCEGRNEPLPLKGGGLHQIIVGGESGPGARPFDVGWARSTVEQCRAAGVACFVKQLGPKPFESRPADGVEKGTESALRRIGTDHPQRPWFRNWTLVHWGNQSRWHRYYRISDPKGGDPSEWPEDLRVREWPA